MSTVINGSTGIDKVQDGIVTDAKLNLTANNPEIKEALNASGNAPIYACRAWVNFNGTGTVAIRASGNVSSITDNGVGFYFINLAVAIEDANYAVAVSAGDVSSSRIASAPLGSAPTTSQFKMQSLNNSGTPTDIEFISAAVFR